MIMQLKKLQGTGKLVVAASIYMGHESGTELDPDKLFGELSSVSKQAAEFTFVASDSSSDAAQLKVDAFSLKERTKYVPKVA